VTFEHPQPLAARQPPASYREVARPGQQGLPRPVCSHARHRPGVLGERPQRFGLLERPDDRGTVGGTGDEDVRIGGVAIGGGRNEDHWVDPSSVPDERARTLARVEVPAARRSVVRAAEDDVAAPYDAIHRLNVSSHDDDALARSHVPLADGRVGRAADGELFDDQNAVDVALVADEDTDALGSVGQRRPQPQRLVVAGGDDDRAVCRARHGIDAARVAGQHVQLERVADSDGRRRLRATDSHICNGLVSVFKVMGSVFQLWIAFLCSVSCWIGTFTAAWPPLQLAFCV